MHHKTTAVALLILIACFALLYRQVIVDFVYDWSHDNNSPLNCLPGAGWQPVRHELLALPAGNATIQINRIVIVKGSVTQVVLYWYQGHARVIASEYQAKL